MIHSATIKDKDAANVGRLKQNSTALSNKGGGGLDIENENQSNSSFQTLGMPNSYVRTAKHLSQFREEDIYSSLSPMKSVKPSDSSVRASEKRIGIGS